MLIYFLTTLSTSQNHEELHYVNTAFPIINNKMHQFATQLKPNSNFLKSSRHLDNYDQHFDITKGGKMTRLKQIALLEDISVS